MGRRRSPLGVRALAFLLTLTMAANLVPVPALAEMVEEAAGGDLVAAAPGTDDAGLEEVAGEEEPEEPGDAGIEPVPEDGDADGEIEPGSEEPESEEEPSGIEEDDPDAAAPEEPVTEALGASAEAQGVTYVERGWDAAASTVTSTTATADSVSTVPSDGSMTEGWYYLDRDVTVNGRVCLEGDTSLILGDGHTLDVRGLYVPAGSTLAVYAQSDGDGAGKIYSHPSGGAGIGGYSGHDNGNVVIHGGTVVAEGHKNCAGVGTNDGMAGGEITIYGGDVTATGGESGAGIGGGRGCEGGDITIYGGRVEATGGHYAAGIGGGNGQGTDPMRGGHGGTIAIWGDDATFGADANRTVVTATGGDDGAGIGGGEGGNAGTVTINGGHVTAQGGNNSAGIGCGEGESTGVGGTVTVSGGTVVATGGGDAAGIGGGVDGHCATIAISGGTDTTKVTATGGANGAGIGAGRDSDGGTIAITGGTVVAEGRDSSAGIGGGDASGSYADYSVVEITGGNVTATGNSKGAGIGGGEYGHATVTITGGTVTATANGTGAGIGDGRDGSGSGVTLGWTDSTQDVSVTASSYKGNVTLAQPFKSQIGSPTFRATNSVSDLAALAAASPLVAWTDAGAVPTEVEAGSWAALQDAINGATGSLTVTLTGPVTAGPGDAPITVPDGKDITIDLKGFELSRGLTGPAADGSAVVVASGAALTVTDSSAEGTGAITGGNTTGYGGGIRNSGTLTIAGGTISGNAASQWGGGVYLSNDTGATLHLDGGAIEGNSCGSDKNGGGVHVSERAFMTVSGSPRVTGNTKGAGEAAPANDVSLASGAFVYVTGALTEDATIGVRMSNDAGNITSGLRGRGGAGNFFANNADYEVAIDGAGEAYLYKRADGTASTWQQLQDAVRNASDGQVIELTESVFAADNDGAIEVDGKTVTLDLKGNALDRNLISEESDGHAIELKNGASLTIRDSVGGGVVTGGFSEDGGGIYVGEGCTCTITGGSVTGNSATDDGGGIFVAGTLKTTGGTITANHADDDGGGIYVNDKGKIDLTGASITYNTANDGGGLRLQLGANSSITRCRITYNESEDYGGGLFMDGSGKTLTITDTAIDRNRSSDDGAGMYLNNGTIQMEGGSLSDNISDNDGGGVKVTKGTTLNANGVEISDNTASDEEGGGVKNYGTTTLTDCTITGNTAKKQGGGAYNNDVDGSAGVMVLEDCTIKDNSSQDVGGGVYSNNELTLVGGSITKNYATKQGGGVFIGSSSENTNISGKLIVGENEADMNAPDMYLRNGLLAVTAPLTAGARIGVTKEDDGGLGIFTTGYSTYNSTEDPAGYFFSPEGLEIVAERGEASLASTWDDLRVRIANAEDGDLITLEKNYTASAKDDRLKTPAGKSVTIDLNGYTLNRNRTSRGSDGHVIEVLGTLILKDSSQKKTGTVTGGWATHGGGINISSAGKLVLQGGNITGNKSEQGGGIYNHGTLEMSGGNVSGNRANDKWGGGIYNEKTMTMSGGTVTGNYSDRDGGGVYSEGTSTISGGEIKENTAKKSGGAIRVNGGTTTISGGTISGNVATDDHGGAIYVSKGSSVLSLYGGEISGNTAMVYGGGIYVDEDIEAINIKGKPVVKNNRAAQYRDIYLEDDKQLTVTGKLEEGAELYVDPEENGQVTSGYGAKNQNADPTAYFHSRKGLPIILYEGEVYFRSHWEHLQELIEATADKGTLTLDQDYEALSSDDRLQIPLLKTITIDLNGHTLDRNRESQDKDGHVIEVFGTLTLKDGSASKAGTITGGWAENGGGININALGKLVFESGTISGNKANNGGGIYAHGELSMTGGTVRDNTADKDGGGICCDTLYIGNGRVVRMNADISGGSITNNTAAKSGGGIRVLSGTTTISGGTISGNTATDDHGGGIYISKSVSVLNLYGGEISGNAAGQEGGGVLVAADTDKVCVHGAPVVKENTAGVRGSNVYLREGKIDVDGAISSGARIGVAKKGGDGVFTNDFKKNGEVDDPATCFVPDPGYKVVWDDEDDRDEAKLVSLWPHVQKMINDAENEGTVTLDSDYMAGSDDDRLQIPEGKTVTIDLAGHTLDRNRVSRDGDGHVFEVFGTLILMDSSDTGDKPGTGTITGGWANNGGGINVASTGKLVLQGGNVTGNKSEQGGGIYNKGTLEMSGGTVSDNRANDKWGGGVYNEGTATISGGTVSNNYSDRDGGGVYSEGTTTISGGTISENTAKKSGGGIRVNGGTTTISGGTISKNTATEDNGGGVYVSKETSQLNVSGGTITENTAKKSGGAIYNNDGTIDVTDGTITSNTADNDGGGIWSDGKLTVSGGTIEKNTAKRDGGAIYTEDTTTVSGGTISENTATKSGGAIRVEGGTTTVEGGTISKNTATEDHGGGVYVSDGTLKLYGGEISKNTAGQEGGGVLVSGDTKDVYVHGAPVVKENTATVRGSNIYLREDKASVDGVLSEDAELCVSMKSGTGRLTADYDDYENPTDVEGIAKIFTPEKGLKLAFKDGEVWIDSDWSTLRKDLKAMKGTNELTLPQDYTAGDDDNRLEIPEGATVTIDLAGHTLNRNRVSRDGDGHVFEVFGTLTLLDSSADKTGTITGGWANNGGGINVASTGKLVLQGGNVTGNKSEQGGGIYNKGTLEMSGGTVSDNRANDKWGGGVYNEGTATISGGTVSNNYSDRDGGGVYSEGTTTISGGTISENTAKKSGGGIRVNGGTTTISGGTISKNTATEDNGGGVYMSKDDSRLELFGGEITGNAARGLGCGVYASKDTGGISIKGAPVVKDNTGNTGDTVGSRNDVYLPEGETLRLVGKLDAGCNIGVSLEKDWGVFTSGYGTYTNTEEEVTSLFTSTEGYTVYLQGTEAALGRDSFGETEFERPFIDSSNQVRDSGALNSRNWMAGISGERYLNEINLPASHDSGMKEVESHFWGDWTSLNGAGPAVSIVLFTVAAICLVSGCPFVFLGLGAFAGLLFYLTAGSSALFAQTQNLFINEQLEAGYRKIDLRLNNRRKVSIWGGVIGWRWEDDGKNLYIGHGKQAIAGNAQALDDEGDLLTFNKVLDWVADFLERHPSETIIMDISPETTKKSDNGKIMTRARRILREFSQRTNSATGESFLYLEPGADDYLVPYTHTPQVKDCRGKIVLMSDDEYLDMVGGYNGGRFGIDYRSGPTFSFVKEKKVAAVEEKLEGLGVLDNPTSLLTDAESTYDHWWATTLNCTGQDDLGSYLFEKPTPLENEAYVFDKLVGDGKLISSDRTGQYIGWLSMDSANEEVAQIIWKTNFFDGLEYRTVTVQTGLDPDNPDFKNYKTQTYKLLKGSDFTIPGCIYKDLPEEAGYFAGWKSDDGTDYAPNTKYTISDDVTFTAQWLTSGEVPVSVAWRDGDDADDLRPSQIGATVSFPATAGIEDKDVTIGEDDGWRTTVEAAATAVVPTWELVKQTADAPNGQDRAGEYRYESTFEQGVGHVITFTHTPDRTVSVSGTITWDDRGNEDGTRPASVTLRLLKNGEEVQGAAPTLTGTDTDEWGFSFEGLPGYEDGEQITYAVEQAEVDGYATEVDGLTIKNSHIPRRRSQLDEVAVQIDWVDNDNEFTARPEKVTIRLLADGEEVEERDIQNADVVGWRTVFEDLPMLDESGERIKYTVTQDAVDGYETDFAEYTEDGIWIFTNTYGPHEHKWTFTGFQWIGDEKNGYTDAAAIYECTEGPVKHEKGVGITIGDDATKTVPATCEAGGKTEYTATVPAAESLDGEEHSETREAKLEDALGHDWGDAAYEWSEDHSACTATRVCGNDPGHTETAEATVTSEMTREPTADAPGERTYTATFAARWADEQTWVEQVAADQLRLAAYSTDEGCSGSVADVTVTPLKDAYSLGEEVTVGAPAKVGYEFVGWHEVESVEGGLVTAYGDLLSADASYTFAMAADAEVCAVYRATGSATVTVVPVNGAEYTVSADPDKTVHSGETIWQVNVGETLKLTAAESDKVLHWLNESDKVVGTGEEHAHYVTSSTTITLVYTSEAETGSYVEFVSDYEQVLSHTWCAAGADAIQFPTTPTKYGHTFQGWVFEGTGEEATEQAILARVGTEHVITVRPKYARDAATGRVTVSYLDGGGEEIAAPTTTSDIPLGNAVSPAAPEVDGYTFDHWEDKGGGVLGYKPTYFMTVAGDHELVARYVAEGSEADAPRPVITIAPLQRVVAGDVRKVRGTVTRSVPEGCQIIEHGMLYARGEGGLTEETFVAGTEGVSKAVSNKTGLNGVVSVNLKVADDEVVCSFRGYMLVRDESGNERYYYSEILEGSYGSIA